MRSRSVALALLFLLSGAAALVVETTWQRWFRLLLGATAPATAATLVAFFTGQALGAGLGGRFASGRRDPLVLYGWLELGAAACALLVPVLLGPAEALLATVYDGLVGRPGILTSLRFALALAVSLPAAICFGATLPAMAAAIMPDARELGSKGAGFYGINLVGAVLGTLLAAFLLPERIGIPATYAVGLALSGVAGGSALALAKGARGPADRPAVPGERAEDRDPREPREAQRVRPARTRIPGSGGLLALAVLSGGGSFALQVLLVHCFGLVLNQSVYAFGLVLASVLASLAIGALLVAILDRKLDADPRQGLALALAIAALGVVAFPALFVAQTDGLTYLGVEGGLLRYLTRALALVLKTAGPALLPVSLVFPLTLAWAARGPRARGSAAAAMGALAAANTVGAIAGALAAPFLLLPGLGPWLAFTALAAAYAVAALAIPLPQTRWRLRRDLLLGVGWILLLSRGNPLSLPVVGLPPESLLRVEHTSAGTVAVALHDGERLIQIDNHYSLGGTAERTHAERQGHLPLVLAPGARRVAFLGSATGISAGAATLHPVERIVLVELVPGVSDAARDFFRDANREVYEDRRASVVLDDARNFLRLTRESFDVIVADLFVPWRAGTGSLYTLEHFRAARDRLGPEGLFCQWLPLYQLSESEFRIIAATFLDVFPQAEVYRGDFFGRFPIVALVGRRSGPAAPQEIASAARRLAGAGVHDRWVVDPAGVFALLVGSLDSLAPELGSVPRQRDARPVLEYRTARGHRQDGSGRRDVLVALDWARLADTIRRRSRERLRDLGPEWQAAVEAGAALQTAGAYYAAGRPRDSGRALAIARQRLPARLLEDAGEDPTALEVWFR